MMALIMVMTMENSIPMLPAHAYQPTTATTNVFYGCVYGSMVMARLIRPYVGRLFIGNEAPIVGTFIKDLLTSFATI